MKKLLAGITAMGLVLALSGTMAVSAHSSHGHHNGQSKSQCTTTVCRFVDANDDGICDHKDNCTIANCSYVDANGDGICDNKNVCTATNCNYADADGDGRCDYCGVKSKTHCKNHRHGTGSGKHNRHCR